jgi:U3 small nucleolar RNA-associated protein 13
VLCSASGDRTIKLWSMNDYSCLKSLEGHSASVLAVRFVAFQLPSAPIDSVTGEAVGSGSRKPTYNSMQIMSASADGLIRLWDIRSGESVRTFDEHQDKVWALAFPKDGGHSSADEELSPALNELGAFFVTAGSDSRMVIWRDNTQEEETTRLEELEGRALAEQAIDSDMRAGRHGKVCIILSQLI